MKKLALAIVAVLAVGASAQTRHYATSSGLVTATPAGKFETRLVEVTPVTVINTVRTLPADVYIRTVPASETVMEVRHYDTADTSDELLLVPSSKDYEVLYETRSTTVIDD